MYQDLQIIVYPDPRLKRISRKVVKFDANLAALAKRMLEMMRAAPGVGLAAPQVGHNIRLFVTNHTGKPEDDRVYVNPILSDAEGEETASEGCLSLPDIHADVARGVTVRMTAVDLEGKPIKQLETGYLPRIWQHELDHLNGTLIIDRMGPTAQMEARKVLKDLEEKYKLAHPTIEPETTKTKKRPSRSR